MSQPNSSVDIAVVGGGLAGLTAALSLARTRRSVALFAPQRPADGRTTALLGDSVEAMRALGILETLQETAAPLRAIRLIDATNRLIRAPEMRFDAAEVGLEAFGYNVPNRLMAEALDAALEAAGVLRFESAVSVLTHGPAHVALSTERGDRLDANLVVGADGRGSPTRIAAGIAFDQRPMRQAALVADFHHTVDHEGVSTEFHTAKGPFTLVPLAGKRSALVWVTDPERAERLRNLSAEGLAAEVEAQASSILGAMTLEGPAQVFRLSSASARRYSESRIVLIGEAAHIVPPIAAQGFNLTLGDVAALTDLVRDSADPGDEAVTAAYDRRRRAQVRLRAGAVGALNRSLLTDLLPVQLARSAGLFALSVSPVLRRLAMRQGLGAGRAA